MNVQKILLLILFTFSLSSYSFDIKKINDQLFITGNDCKKIERVVVSLSAWKKNSGEENKCVTPKNLKSDNAGKCKYNITQCVPSHVLTYQDVKPEVVGPNCWNLALVMKGLLPALRHSNAEEMEFLTKPPLCYEIKNGQKPSPGDLGAIRIVDEKGDSTDEHGFIYVSDDILYSKNGLDNETPYQLQPTSRMDNVYDLGFLKSLLKCVNEQSRNCKITKYFKCDSIQDYFKKRADLPTAFIATAYHELDRAENCLQLQLFKKGIDENTINSHITNSVKILTKLLASEEQEISNLSDPDKLLILGSIKLRLDSIKTQISMNLSSTYEPEYKSLITIFNEKLATHVQTRCKSCGLKVSDEPGESHSTDWHVNYEECSELSKKVNYECYAPELYVPKH